MSTKTSKLLDKAMSTFSDVLREGVQDWPENVHLYKSLEEQELLYDKAWCYSIETLLAVHELQDGYNVERRHNSEHMAPKKGHVPFLRIEDEVVGKYDILDYLTKMEKVLFADRSLGEDLCIKGIISIIENKLTPMEYYVAWVEESNRQQTHEIYGHGLPSTLQKILCYQKEQEVKTYLRVTGWLNKTNNEIIMELRNVFNFFSKQLQTNRFIGGELLSEADVYVYGHLQAIYESNMKTNFLKETLQQFPKLAEFCLDFNRVQLGKKAMIF